MIGLTEIVDTERYPIGDRQFIRRCRTCLEHEGALTLPGFIRSKVLAALKRQAFERKHLAYFCTHTHTVYLSPPDPAYTEQHARNRPIVSTKGCITDDQIPTDSPLRRLYGSGQFKRFLCAVLNETVLYPYADPLSSINVHYYETGQELGWHFDNSSFAITLMIQAPQAGGEFQYVKSLRSTAHGEKNYAGVEKVLDGEIKPSQLQFTDGMLVLFRGRDTLHRVTPIRGTEARIQVVFAYNAEPGIPLSEEARQTFYGRIA